jgi:hypothetical protein
MKESKWTIVKEALLTAYKWGKKTALQTFGGLVMDKKDGLWIISMTKMATWIVLGHSLYIWNQVQDAAGITRQDISQGELYILMSLLGVAGIKIGAKAVTDVVARKYEAPAGASEE